MGWLRNIYRPYKQAGIRRQVLVPGGILTLECDIGVNSVLAKHSLCVRGTFTQMHTHAYRGRKEKSTYVHATDNVRASIKSTTMCWNQMTVESGQGRL